jgi:hypothetical protein
MMNKVPKEAIDRSKDKRTRLGTDEAFWQLMTVSGSSILKLLGMPADQADKYQFRAVVLKDKKLAPDIEGIPLLESDEGRVFLEFQSYEDKFIRYRLLAELCLGCLYEQYHGPVVAGIIFTDEKYQTAAWPLTPFPPTERCQWGDCWPELALSKWTAAQLCATDPHLILLAPFTLPKTTDKATLLEKGREWQAQVVQSFPATQQPAALNVLGLFVLSRFHKLSYEEVRIMLDVDLMKSLAVRQVYKRGLQKGERKGERRGLLRGIQDTQEMVLEALDERFGVVSSSLIDQIRALKRPEVLKSLLRQALRCQSLESFQEILTQVK